MDSGSSIVAAVEWLRALLTGSLATSIAVVAVAACGMAMMSGRLSWRTSVRVIAGCAIIFGASQIANGLSALGDDERGKVVAPSAPPIYSSGNAVQAPEIAAGGTSSLDSVYVAVRQATSIRFPAASGVIHLRATTGPDGKLTQLDVSSETLRTEVTELAGRIIGASGLRLPTKRQTVVMPDLPVGRADTIR